ncbi:serine/threonine-protein kinase [Kitasatospora sp. NBC_01266]|uniref:serine/threonine-protein kinase n=1 Tax=Kitasatospora sp. NBC_01266 TaxID=2903572 RepID=UPI002E36CF48|nr:protein kinase [Kitasatospora sp. NBC_01266]
MWGRGTELGGRYTLTERLGGGAMGEVWRAEDSVLGRQVAVKILLPGLLDDATFMERFRREARLLASINHPGIVEVHDYGESGEEAEDRVAYIVMELITGRPLDVVLTESGPLPAERALEIVAQALDALHAAHQRGIVHRDIKPSNLMLREDDRVAVTDFGIASAMAGTRITSSHAVLGTALYVAPERAEGAASNPASDLYSMGVLCYEMLVGEPPFTGETALEIVLKHVREPAPELPGSFAQPVRDLVATALAKPTEERFANAAEMAAAARGAAQGVPVAAVIASRTIPLVKAKTPPAAELEVAPAAKTVATPTVGADPDLAKTQPDVAPRRPWIRRRFVLPLLIPCGVTVVVGSAVLIDQTPFSSDAAARDPHPVTSVVAGRPLAGASAPGSGSPSASGPASPSPSTAVSASASAPAAPSSATPSGSSAPGVSAPAGGGGQGAAQPQGGGGAAPAPGGGSGARTGGGTAAGGGGGGTAATGTGSGGGAGGSNGSNPGGGGGTGSGGSSGGGSAPVSQPTTQPPNPAPPAAGPPAGCGGSGWGAIVNVGDGLKAGLADGNPSGSGAVIMGGNTSYGWLRGAVQTWATFTACNANDSPLGVVYYGGTGIQLVSGYAGPSAWTVVSAPSGVYVKDYLGQNCLTDNGAGRQLTMGTCTPGNSSQEWQVP